MSDSVLTNRTIDPFSREVLEFPAVLELLHSYLSGPISEPLLAQVEPHTQLEKIRRDLELAGEARDYLRESSRPSLAGIVEPSPLLDKLRVEGLALHDALPIWLGRGSTSSARLPSIRRLDCRNWGARCRISAIW